MLHSVTVCRTADSGQRRSSFTTCPFCVRATARTGVRAS
jgi:hypothetical protein